MKETTVDAFIKLNEAVNKMMQEVYVAFKIPQVVKWLEKHL